MDVHIKPSTLYVHVCIQNFENINKTQTVEWYILKRVAYSPRSTVHVILHLIIIANIYLILNERCVHQCKRT